MGQSVVWIIGPRLNALVDVVWTREPERGSDGRTAPRQSWTLCPAVRWAHTVGDVVIAPAVGVVLGGDGGPSGLVSIAIEHGFGRRPGALKP